MLFPVVIALSIAFVTALSETGKMFEPEARLLLREGKTDPPQFFSFFKLLQDDGSGPNLPQPSAKKCWFALKTELVSWYGQTYFL